MLYPLALTFPSNSKTIRMSNYTTELMVIAMLSRIILEGKKLSVFGRTQKFMIQNIHYQVASHLSILHLFLCLFDLHRRPLYNCLGITLQLRGLPPVNTITI